ncbi:MAG: hypothetical protein KAK00_09470 [Nanoarchaeota archaeon]|nr:hypothetical protein [Nanoarchaeota archaeon]
MIKKILLALVILSLLPIVYADSIEGDKSAIKEVTLIVPEKIIAIDLEYNKDSPYDEDNDGEESVNGVVDLTVENTEFNWDVDESKLCTRWETYSENEGKATTLCYGSEECCSFIEFAPLRSNWNETHYAVFNKYGAGLNNIVSARVIYYDVDLSSAKAEILNSEWSNLPVKFYYGAISNADSIEDKINSIVKYGEQYEMGQISYLQMIVHSNVLRQDINKMLSEKIEIHYDGHIEYGASEEEMRRIFGAPADITPWVWVVHEEKEIRIDERKPRWEKTVFDGKKLRITFNAWPNVLREEDGSLTNFYWVDFDTRFKRKFDFNINSMIDDIKNLAESFLETNEGDQELAERMVEYRNILHYYLQENRENCLKVIKEFFEDDEKVSDIDETRWEIYLYEGDNLELRAEVNSCNGCEWPGVDIWFDVRMRDVRSKEAEIKFKKFNKEKYRDMTIDELNSLIEKKVAELARKAEQADRSRSGNIMRDKIEIRSEVRIINWVLDEKYYDQKNESERQENYKKRIQVLESIFSKYGDIYMYPLNEVRFQRRLLENIEERQDSFCRELKHDECSKDDVCWEGECINATGGDETCDNKIDDDGDHAIDCDDPDCSLECGRACDYICRGECDECHGEQCRDVCEDECWPCYEENRDNWDMDYNPCESTCQECDECIYSQCQSQPVCDECNACHEETYKCFGICNSCDKCEEQGGCEEECRECDKCKATDDQRECLDFCDALGDEKIDEFVRDCKDLCRQDVVFICPTGKQYTPCENVDYECNGTLVKSVPCIIYECEDGIKQTAPCGQEIMCGVNQYADVDKCVCNEGYYDCDDNATDCEATEECQQLFEKNCNDRIDNDNDGLTDCEDLLDCRTGSFCGQDPADEPMYCYEGDCASTTCGNGICDANETLYSCPPDCRLTKPVCGDDICSGNETEESCPEDCSICPPGQVLNKKGICVVEVVCPIGHINVNGTCVPPHKKCVKEGKNPGKDKQCCEGLKAIRTQVGDGRICSLTAGYVCSPCGNGECEERENTCNCPEDCPCEEGKTYTHICRDGTEVPMCECSNGKWDCVTAPENQCPAQVCGNGICEGDELETCQEDCQCGCPDTPETVCGRNNKTYTNSCQALCAGTHVRCSGACPCPVCGDGICESNENLYCPEDCPIPICNKGFVLNEEGECVPLNITCEDWQEISEEGLCVDICGNGRIDEKEDCESCPNDVICRLGYVCENKECVPEEITCPEGQVLNEKGKCVKECLKEGEYTMDVKDCCPDLRAIRIHVGDGRICSLTAGYVCTAFCGDGKCGDLENPCNCRKDCPVPEEVNVSCTTNADCGADTCHQGKNVCSEHMFVCENDGSCSSVSTEYEDHSCARYYSPELPYPESIKCLDTCGDGVCKRPENRNWCPEDCREGELCGNRVIDPEENCANCPKDAACEKGFSCENKECVPRLGVCPEGMEPNEADQCVDICGNGKIDEGEDCDSCPNDVSCSDNFICENKECVPEEITCPDGYVLSEEGTCELIIECKKNQQLTDQGCIPIEDDCMQDDDCIGKEECRAGVCVAPPKPKCETDEECPKNKICSDGICVKNIETPGPPEPELTGEECILVSDCSGENDICSNGECKEIPEEFIEEEEEKKKEKKAESKKEEAKEEKKEKGKKGREEPEPVQEEPPAEESMEKITGDSVLNTITGFVTSILGLAVEDGCKEDSDCGPTQNCDPFMGECHCKEYYFDCNSRDGQGNDEDGCESQDPTCGGEREICEECNENQYCDEKRGHCECDEGFWECDGYWKNGCESEERCEICEDDSDCMQDVCAPWDMKHVINIGCVQGSTWKEETGVVIFYGNCNFHPTGIIHPDLGFDAWGESFEQVQWYKEVMEQFERHWCDFELGNLIKRRIELQESYNHEFLSWFFEEYVNSEPGEWDKNIGGIYDAYWMFVDNSKETNKQLRCLNLNKFPSEYELVNEIEYESEFGHLKFWEEKAIVDGVEIFSPYMQIWIFPPKEFIKENFRTSMEKGVMPGPPGEEKPGPSPVEIKEAKQDKKFMKEITDISDEFEGSADFLITVNDDDEILYKAMLTINPEIIFNFEIKNIDREPDVTISVDFEFLYEIIEMIEKEMELERPPWDERPGIREKIKGAIDQGKILAKITGAITTGKIKVSPVSQIGKVTKVLGFMFDQGPKDKGPRDDEGRDKEKD